MGRFYLWAALLFGNQTNARCVKDSMERRVLPMGLCQARREGCQHHSAVHGYAHVARREFYRDLLRVVAYNPDLAPLVKAAENIAEADDKNQVGGSEVA